MFIADMWYPQSNPSRPCLLWHLPNELLLLIVEELDWESLQRISQICRCLLEIAMKCYLGSLKFQDTCIAVGEGDWRVLRDEDCEALLIWRCTKSFKVPRVVWFAGLWWMGNCQFHALSVFFNSLMGLEPVQQAHLCLYVGPTQDSPGLLSCVESIQVLRIWYFSY